MAPISSLNLLGLGFEDDNDDDDADEDETAKNSALANHLNGTHCFGPLLTRG
jgi:hypothetical protein